MKRVYHLLIVEDDTTVREHLAQVLGQAAYHLTAVGTVQAAREALINGQFDLGLFDMRLPDGDGLSLLKEMRDQGNMLGVIVITGFAAVDTAIEALRLGAVDFLEKPVNMDTLQEHIKAALQKTDTPVSPLTTKRTKAKKTNLGQGIVGSCPAMNRVMETVRLAADSDATILITGESGTGKEVIARALHTMGSRADKAFVPINCGAIPEELLESELFGHTKGAFTGAVKTRPGRFEIAHQGTIFLDEIGDMSHKLQVKLLRVLQERCFEPVGSHESVHVDVHVLAATHRDLEKEIAAGNFREDLYYRLSVIPIHIPPLRERGEDIHLIAKHFMQFFNKQRRANLEGMDEQVCQMMNDYPWPGNVRELANLMERLATLKRSGMVTVMDLPSKMLNEQGRLEQELHEDTFGSDSIDFNALVEEYENRLLASALKRFDWNKNRAAKFLSMNRTTLVEKLKKKGMQPA